MLLACLATAGAALTDARREIAIVTEDHIEEEQVRMIHRVVNRLSILYISLSRRTKLRLPL